MPPNAAAPSQQVLKLIEGLTTLHVAKEAIDIKASQLGRQLEVAFNGDYAAFCEAEPVLKEHYAALYEAKRPRPAGTARSKPVLAWTSAKSIGWKRIVHRYAFPGSAPVDDTTWMRLPDGTTVPNPAYDKDALRLPVANLSVPDFVAALLLADNSAPPRLGLVASGVSGKTLLGNQICAELMVQSPDLQIVILTATAPDQWGFAAAAGCAVEEWSLDGLTALISGHLSIPAPSRHRLIVVLEDVGAEADAIHNKEIDRLFLKYRNQNIGVILLSQQGNALLNPTRGNNMGCCLFADLDKSQIRHLYDKVPFSSRQLTLRQFEAWIFASLGRTHGYGFGGYFKDNKESLFLVKAELPPAAAVSPAKPAPAFKPFHEEVKEALSSQGFDDADLLGQIDGSQEGYDTLAEVMEAMNLEDKPALPAALPARKPAPAPAPAPEPAGRAPVISYAGGKSKGAPILLSHIPERFNTLVSPFIGGGGLEFAFMNQKDGSSTIAFDADGTLIAMYRALQTDKEAVRREIFNLDEDCFDECRAVVEDPSVHPPAYVAACKMAAHRLSYGGFGLNRHADRGIGDLASRVDVDLSGMTFQQQDCFDTLAWFKTNRKTDWFLYLDPPYPDLERFYDIGTGFEHERLASELKSIGTPYWALSYNDHPTVRALYQDWCDITVVGWSYSLTHNTDGKELLITPRRV